MLVLIREELYKETMVGNFERQLVHDLVYNIAQLQRSLY